MEQCVHHFIVPFINGEESVVAVCKHCQEERVLHTTFLGDMDVDWFKGPRVRLGKTQYRSSKV